MPDRNHKTRRRSHVRPRRGRIELLSAALAVAALAAGGLTWQVALSEENAPTRALFWAAVEGRPLFTERVSWLPEPATRRSAVAAFSARSFHQAAALAQLERGVAERYDSSSTVYQHSARDPQLRETARTRYEQELEVLNQKRRQGYALHAHQVTRITTSLLGAFGPIDGTTEGRS